MAEEPTDTPPGKPDSPQRLSPEEQASYDSLLAALEKVDLSKALAEAGISVETAPDGTWIVKDRGDATPFDPAASSATGTLPSAAPDDSLATNPHHGENDMGLLDRFRICICSDVTGVITDNGKPVEGAEIIRRLDLYLPKDGVYTDTTVTDAQGRFSFKPAYARKRKPLLSEVCTEQLLLVRHEDKLYLGWGNRSHGKELHQDLMAFSDVAEPGYHPLDFDGDLSRATPLPDDVDLDRLDHNFAFFNSQIVYIASILRFFVTMNGEPVVGAKITRTAEHVGHKSYVQTKISDGDGEVEMDSIVAAHLAHKWEKTEIKQRVIISYEGRDYLAWEKTKTNPWNYGEYNLDKKKIMFQAEITAELTDEPQAIRGVVTDVERCWKGEEGEDYLPPDAIQYKGLFRVTRYDR